MLMLTQALRQYELKLDPTQAATVQVDSTGLVRLLIDGQIVENFSSYAQIVDWLRDAANAPLAEAWDEDALVSVCDPQDIGLEHGVDY